jgi:membrane-associated protein
VRDLLGAFSLDPEKMLDAFGAFATIGLFLIVFAESGLLIGFFLPGDSLLFTAGVLASKGDLNIVVILVGCFVAAVLGDQVGYNIGKRLGPTLFRRPDSRIFKQDYVHRTKDFFERHGPKTIVIARFVPIVRTFAPVLAGVGEMRYRTFSTYNVVGAFFWAVGVTFAGYALGEIIGDDIDKYLLPLIGLVILASLVPPLLEWRRHRKLAPEIESIEEAREEVEELEHLLNPDE